jgi:hypothetical protein
MPKPLAICIEDLAVAALGARYLACVVLPGGAPGLWLDGDGAVRWQGNDQGVACDLFVSLDEQLMLYRPQAGASVTVHRDGRSLDAPFERPVVLLDQDELEVGHRRLRVHVHGAASEVTAPRPYVGSNAGAGGDAGGALGSGVLARAAAAVLALGTALAGGGCKGIEVRERPPKVPAQLTEASAAKDTGKAAPETARPDRPPAPPDAGRPADGAVRGKPPIEVRPMPPMVAPPRPPTPPTPATPATPPTPPPRPSEPERKK